MKYTQEQVNEAHKEAKTEFERLKTKFKGDSCALIMNREVTGFLGQYEICRQQVLEDGFSMPALDDKIKVTVHD